MTLSISFIPVGGRFEKRQVARYDRSVMDAATSKNQVSIRLTAERWLHITEEHSELAGMYFDVLEYISNPDMIVKGSYGELIAIKRINQRKAFCVVYREVSKYDGFVITAFTTSKIIKISRRIQIWPPK